MFAGRTRPETVEAKHRTRLSSRLRRSISLFVKIFHPGLKILPRRGMFHKQQSGSLPAGEKVKSDSEIRNEAPKQPWLNRNEWILFAITSVWFSVFAFFSVDLHHDGVMLKPAMDVAAGGVVFRDTFSQYGILSPLLQGAVERSESSIQVQ